MGKLRPKEGNDQPGVPARHQLSKSSSLGQDERDHPCSRGSGGIISRNVGGIKVLVGVAAGMGWGGELGSGRLGHRAAGRGLECVGEGAARGVATANRSPKWEGGGWEEPGLGTSRRETEVGPPRWARPHPPRDASRPRLGPALPARLPAAPRGLTCSRGGRSRGRS